MSDTTKTKPRRKSEATRLALMQAGFRVFSAKGFIRAQISDITREAGKTSGVFYLYFKNKEQLLNAWLVECDKTVPWYQADTSLLCDKARAFILQSYWSLYEKFGPIVDALEAAALISDDFNKRFLLLQAKGNQSIARMIRHAQGEGRYTGVDAELTAVSISALITKTTAYWFRNREALEARGFDETEAKSNLEILYDRMLQSSNDRAHKITESARSEEKRTA